MKRALHLATKFQGYSKMIYNCFWVPSYDLFTSPRTAVHGKGPRNYNVQPRLVGGGVGGEVICHKKVQQSFLNQSLDPRPIKNSWIRRDYNYQILIIIS